ncbi:hypothetical protein FOL47_007426 [Perkinsus chesapeaki]|uniref:Aluminum-activated malate transporter 1 n=1 Tax=Perkinsus chesapeaki TaxID=330153 RepID=A0A7J6MVW9_PERCH|nr:hypothetical protein FOL47_007426 [Perkinsus chesapeaki]
MTLPKKPSSVSTYALASALFTTACVAFAIIPVYAYDMKNSVIFPRMMVGAVVSQGAIMDIRGGTMFTIKGLITIIMAFGIGEAMFQIVLAVCEALNAPYSRIWATVVTYPFSLFFALGTPTSRCKLGDYIMPNVASAFVYIPTSLYFEEAAQETLVAFVMAIYAFFIPIVFLALLKATGLLITNGPPPMVRFACDAAAFNGLLNDYFVSAGTHKEVLDAAEKHFNDICVELAKSPLPPEVATILFHMSGELFALHESLVEIGDFEPAIVEKMWKPIAGDLMELRSNVDLVLRQTAEGNTDEDGQLSQKLRDCEANLLRSLDDIGMNVASNCDADEAPEASEVVRFHYATGSLVYFAYLVEKYRVATQAMLKAHEGENELYPYLHPFSTAWNAAKAWWKKPLFADLEDKADLRRRLKFPVRYSIALFCVVLPLSAWAKFSENVRMHCFWSVVPIYMCFLPTPGASLLKGTRRAAGTILGAACSLICIVANPLDRAALLLELLIFSFLGRLGRVAVPWIDYAGFVFPLTFTVVGFGSLLIPGSLSFMLYNACWRIVFTLCGVTLALLGSILFFPEFACDKLRRASGRIIKEVADQIDHQLKLVAACEPGDDVSVTEEELTAGVRDLGLKVYESIAHRANLMADARAEIAVFSPFTKLLDVNRRVMMEQHLITELLRNALVLSSSLGSAAPYLSDPAARVAMEPLLKAIEGLQEAMSKSAEAMSQEISSAGKDRVQPVIDNVNVQLQQCTDIMVEVRNKYLADLMAGKGDLRQLKRESGFRIYHTIYALTAFAEKWNTLEGGLLGRQMPVEGADVAYEVEMDNMETKETRARTQSLNLRKNKSAPM